MEPFASVDMADLASIDEELRVFLAGLDGPLPSDPGASIFADLLGGLAPPPPAAEQQGGAAAPAPPPASAAQSFWGTAPGSDAFAAQLAAAPAAPAAAFSRTVTTGDTPLARPAGPQFLPFAVTQQPQPRPSWQALASQPILPPTRPAAGAAAAAAAAPDPSPRADAAGAAAGSGGPGRKRKSAARKDPHKAKQVGGPLAAAAAPPPHRRRCSRAAARCDAAPCNRPPCRRS
jgi:hypothetical protein